MTFVSLCPSVHMAVFILYTPCLCTFVFNEYEMCLYLNYHVSFFKQILVSIAELYIIKKSEAP